MLTIAMLVCWNCWQVSLAADGQDGSGLQLEKLRLNFSSCFHTSAKKSILMAVVCLIFSLLIKVISSFSC